MITKLSTITTEATVPYENLALEETLLHGVEQGECILYLWQNRKTVVIGKNQNAWKECNISRLSQDGGYLARRISGGGAVFHDLGNLNFTFVAKKEDYDVEKQTEVILCAVKKFGIRAEKNGRNDITVEGKKFSGNAYYQSGDSCFHHGTILLHVDTSDMSKYLNVSEKKLKSKGVESVKSRVTNLSEFLPDITVPMMQKALLEAYEECYGHRAVRIPKNRFDRQEIEQRAARFSSWEWNYGRKLPFDCCLEEKLDWGELQIQLKVNEGRMEACRLYSDTLDTELLQRLNLCLPGTLYQADEIYRVIYEIQVQSDTQRQMQKDIAVLMAESI